MIKPTRTHVAALTLSAAGFVSIASMEGYRGNAYDDGLGIQTIGFGTTEGVRKGQTITVEKAMLRALEDMEKFQGAIKRCVKVPLYQYEYDAYTSFSYNVGEGAFCSSTLVRKLNAGDYPGACAELSRWVCGKKKGFIGRPLTEDDAKRCPTSEAEKAAGFTRFVMPGLEKRRNEERTLCEGPK